MIKPITASVRAQFLAHRLQLPLHPPEFQDRTGFRRRPCQRPRPLELPHLTGEVPNATSGVLLRHGSARAIHSACSPRPPIGITMYCLPSCI